MASKAREGNNIPRRFAAPPLKGDFRKPTRVFTGTGTGSHFRCGMTLARAGFVAEMGASPLVGRGTNGVVRARRATVPFVR